MLVYNKHLLFNMHGMNMKISLEATWILKIFLRHFVRA